MNYEEKYWELREQVDRTFDQFINDCTERSREIHCEAIDEYEAFCIDILERLMKENSDVLKRLKEI